MTKVTNPYEAREIRRKAVKELCLRKGGVMFKLFDLGRLGLEDDERITVFKNAVGNAVRTFVDSVGKVGSDTAHEIDVFEEELLKLGRLVFGDGQKFDAYRDKVGSVLFVLR